jgi:amidophosphoribosyltransferase
MDNQLDGMIFEDKPEEACGVFGIYSDDPDCNAATLTYLGLYALQHRGQESAGIVVSDSHHVSIHKDMGFLANAQPLMARCSKGILAVAHNGNLVNTEEVRSKLEDGGSVFLSTTDTEVIINLIARHSKENLVNAVLKAVAELRGSYSLTIMTKDVLIGLRDPYGVRPLCLGKLPNAYVIASESCAFSSIGASFIRDIAPGELVMIDQDGVSSHFLPKVENQALCAFEYIYLARPDSNIDGLNVHMARKAMGRELAKRFTGEADVVIPVPDTGIATAIGFSVASGIPYDVGLIKNAYVGRTFIQPHQGLRDMGVRIKLNPVEAVLKGKRVVIIDDSIVRGTTSGKIIGLLKEAGAKEVHMCISAPPITHPCYYGVDTSVRKELIAGSHTVEEIKNYLRADSLTYLTIEGLFTAVHPKQDLCMACFNGKYPIEVPTKGKGDKYLLEER